MGAAAVSASHVFVVAAATADAGTDSTGDNVATNTWVNSLQVVVDIDAQQTMTPIMPVLDTEGSVSTRADDIIEYNSDNYTEIGSMSGEFLLTSASSTSLQPASIFTFQEFNSDTRGSMRVHIIGSGAGAHAGKLQFVIWDTDGGVGSVIQTASALALGWHRWSIGWESGSLKFFVDGAEATDTTFLGGNTDNVIPASTTNRFYLGSRNSQDTLNHQDQFFQMPESWLKKWDVKLSDSELKALSL
jgi:hypothetical protein